MNNENKKVNDLIEIKKAFKPDSIVPIFTSLICIAPYLHLLLEIATNNYNRLLFLAFISAPLIAYISVSWTRYFYKMKEYKEEVNSYHKNPEDYNW